MSFQPTTNIFQGSISWAPGDVVTDVKLTLDVSNMFVDFNALATALANAGSSSNANALYRFQNGQVQLRNGDTGLYHSIWIKGPIGQEVICIGIGTI